METVLEQEVHEKVMVLASCGSKLRFDPLARNPHGMVEVVHDVCKRKRCPACVAAVDRYLKVKGKG